jgi:twitching motility protein PilT
LLVNSAIANLIANAKSPQIYSSIETGAGLGMQTLDQSLAQLINAGRISEQTATAMSRNPSLLKDRLRNGNGRGVL